MPDTSQKQNQAINPNTKKFVLELYDEVTNDLGDVIGHRKVVAEQPIIIEASSKAELDEHAKRFKMCGQMMKIVKVIDPMPPKPPALQAQPQQAPQLAPKLQDLPAQVLQQASAICTMPAYAPPASLPAKYYKIGSMQIKEEDGKIYHKQWTKLTEQEASQLRLVSDATGKDVSVKGKHYEMLKWMLADDSCKDSLSLEDQLDEKQV